MEMDKLIQMTCAAGAFKASVIPVAQIKTDACFRDICASNACGMYGKNWMCPPAVGEIHELMAQLRTYRNALVYQTVTDLEDSFDFEGMMRAKKVHHQLTKRITPLFQGKQILHLGAGACEECAQCAMVTGEPCRMPSRAIPSLEAYGVDVTQLAKAAGMGYINGTNTVTYFGVVLFN